MNANIIPIRWCDDAMELLDQRALPDREIWLSLNIESIARLLGRD
ncbi:MAG TPA: hypothetical protein VFM75_04440 [Modicisalibacter sp.]|nr:hypothetical protein [Modicisalibacter sp.]